MQTINQMELGITLIYKGVITQHDTNKTYEF